MKTHIVRCLPVALLMICLLAVPWAAYAATPLAGSKERPPLTPAPPATEQPWGPPDKVTNIAGNDVTVVDSKGREKVFQMNSTAGIRVGTKVWCEESCERALKIGDKVIRVQSKAW